MMQNPEHHEQLGAFYQGLRDVFRAGLQGSSWELMPCRGTYFQLLKVPKSLQGYGDLEAAEWLCQEKGIALIPMSPFYADGRNTGLLRACFAKPVEILEEATALLRNIP
jgi:methionine aminotransferase